MMKSAGTTPSRPAALNHQGVVAPPVPRNPGTYRGRPALPGWPPVRQSELVRTLSGETAVGIERATDADLAFLAMDTGPVPEQFAVVLVLDGVVDAPSVQRLLGERISGVPRLRQRLVRTPWGCGRPIWIEDDAFDIAHHLRTVHCPFPGDEAALMNAVLPLVVEPLPRDRPLWRAAFVDRLTGGGAALVIVTHHVVADGLGGLAVLDRLVDGRDQTSGPTAARRPPPVGRLAADALWTRLHAVRRAAVTWRQLRSAMAAGGGMSPVRAEPCSLVRRGGNRRGAAVVHADLTELRATAHRCRGTVNAALLTAVAAALRRVLERRGETLSAVVVAVPVGRPRTAGAAPGNAVSPLVVTVPATGSIADRIARVADTVRRRRDLATGPAPIAVLGPVFRFVAALGGYRWYMQHQHRLHTLVTFVRGPERPIRFAGATVRTMIPVVVGGATNITVSFQALSYAGSLSVTVVADTDGCPDLNVVAATLGEELARLAADRAQHMSR